MRDAPLLLDTLTYCMHGFIPPTDEVTPRAKTGARLPTCKAVDIVFSRGIVSHSSLFGHRDMSLQVFWSTRAPLLNQVGRAVGLMFLPAVDSSLLASEAAINSGHHVGNASMQ
ncbi:unnamed protein product [Peronospora belbahrii]|uniref:Uncharacterized protein n=1 Tax=Peronospora belbahrii TaxID=622444 RepID=A0ABN8D2J1_9STRA|nr:unnamed protein product [Peronospora belbahrii]